ncbi:hypothetical protein [Bacillus pumilus]|uniref:hypothetical protein n=1 Tax=Bacillus pumilus TaxID=1408 RepID=UPI001C2494EA|nr:hypothetical protein [Bacillus pumilus]MBU8573767.1 hypothetical protein [Bacillus pumilus]
MRNFNNYHKFNPNQKISFDGQGIFERGLEGFQGEEVFVDGNSAKCLIQSKSNDGLFRHILAKPDEITLGSVVEWDVGKWLIVTQPYDNKIYKKAEMRLCNNSIKLSSGDKQVETGKVNEITGKPIKKLVPGEIIEVPCIFERTTSVNGSDQPINLPDGQAHITIPYSANPQLKIGLKTQFYSEEFIVHDIDYSKVIDGVGTIKLIAKKKVSDNK